MFKKILMNMFFIALYYIIYKIGGFEVSVIVALGQIMSSLTQSEYKIYKKVKTPPIKQVYMQPTTRMKF